MVRILPAMSALLLVLAAKAVQQFHGVQVIDGMKVRDLLPCTQLRDMGSKEIVTYMYIYG
jgi:hypothetical protein